jgi:hypothetical protein
VTRDRGDPTQLEPIVDARDPEPSQKPEAGDRGYRQVAVRIALACALAFGAGLATEDVRLHHEVRKLRRDVTFLRDASSSSRRRVDAIAAAQREQELINQSQQEVPTVVGLKIDEAKAIIVAAGLGWTVANDPQGADLVMRQEPESGRIRPGGTVQLYVG